MWGEKLVKAILLEKVKEGQELGWEGSEWADFLKQVRLGGSRDENQQVPVFCDGSQL